ncbi:DUF2267 domain-containing protein [Phytohabitans sp. ZYX-F-186]|uniref:DUF2267 domain-containing protein n=1 Tax=Phytohabitans maris TaxID=3071409 RepID=A0ABU0ZF36_9ACTN|nr:DUF2267 domain-containing protein [Phytohabitans sp. ZYX-F-186]MDQ7904967.1 DUF2267 domain-containing protein [Phytohabitans sp. ZYX-F-186]
MTDDITAHVRPHLEPGGERAGADHIVHAVLRALGDRLPAGEAAYLADGLPAALRPYLRHPGEPASWDDEAPRNREDPIGRIALACDTDEEHARRYARAVLAELAATVPPSAVYDAQVQLPDDVRELFPDPVHAVGHDGP